MVALSIVEHLCRKFGHPKTMFSEIDLLLALHLLPELLALLALLLPRQLLSSLDLRLDRTSDRRAFVQ